MGEIVDDTVDFTVKLIEEPEEPKGVITDIAHPLQLKKNEEIDVEVTVKNEGASTGTLLGGFKVYLKDKVSNEVIDEEPDTYYKDLASGASALIKVNSRGWLGAMPDHDWNLSVELRRKT